jgi:D-alanyl-D-alanine dipeptidase
MNNMILQRRIIKPRAFAILCAAALCVCVACAGCQGVSPAATQEATPGSTGSASAGPTASAPAATPSAAASEGATTPGPSPTPAPSPTPSAQPTATAAALQLYEVTADMLFFRSAPKVAQDNVIALVPKGMRVRMTGQADGSFCCVEAPDGQTGYCSAEFLSPVSGDELPPAVPYVYVAPDKQTVRENGKDVVRTDNLVDVRKVDPSIRIYMIFATDKNFTGTVLYPKDYCLLQKNAAAKLKKAQSMFMKDGYCIKLYDAYRPYSVQKKLWSLVKDSRYIANPKGGSMHNRGAAVDMTLVDKNGVELEMPTPMHTFNETAHRTYAKMTKTARANMDYMTKIMQKAGFSTIRTEWWHFEDRGGKYMRTDYDFRKIYPVYESVSK